MDKVSRKELIQALEELQKKHVPDTELQIFTDAYANLMKRIKAQNKELRLLAEKVLSWVVYSRRQLTLKELQHALALEIGQPGLDRDSIMDQELIATACCGLITINQHEGTVQLIHHTAKEYFGRTRRHWFPEDEIYIAETCIAYLSSELFENGPPREEEHPFYAYAARQWGFHVQNASTTMENIKRMQDLATTFLGNPSRVARMVKYVIPTGLEALEHVAGIHLAAYFRSFTMIAALVTSGHDPNVQDNNGRTPLSFAAEDGYPAIVSSLLFAGANPNIKSTKSEFINRKGVRVAPGAGRTPLLFAAERGHLKAVNALLARKSVLVNLADDCHRTPFYWALRNGHRSVAEALRLRGGSLAPTEDAQVPDRYIQLKALSVKNQISYQRPRTIWISGDEEILEVGKDNGATRRYTVTQY